MQSVLTVICSTLFASRGYPGAHTIPRSLRYAAKRLYELCPKSFLTRRNRRNSPSMARFLLASASMPRHFCALQHNSTDTKQLRYSPTRQYLLPNHRLTPLTLRYNVLVLTCGSDGTALSACMWEAPILRCFPLDTLYSPDGMQCVLKKIMNCHEVPYSLITQKAPAYPQSISTWARG